MKNEHALKLLSCGIVFVSLAICLLLYGEISGFNKGYSAAMTFAFPETVASGEFSSGGPNFYEYIGGGYVFAAFCYGIYLISGLAKDENVLPYIRIASLGIVIYQYWLMLGFKYRLLLNTEVKYPYDDWLRDSIQLDWFCLISAALLVTIHSAVIVLKYTKKSIK